MDRTKIIAHNEATRGERIKLQNALVDAGWLIDYLDVIYPGADIAWTTLHHKSVGVQIKTTSDFMTSWFDGRLQRQLYSLITEVDIPLLLIEGYAYPDRRTGDLMGRFGRVSPGQRKISYTAFVHAMADLTLNAPDRFGLILSPDIAYTVRWFLQEALVYFDKEEFATGWHRIELPPRHTSSAVSALLGWDGIGPETAQALLREYNTAFDAIEALRSGAALKIRGIGPGLIKKVQEQGNGKYAEK